MVTIEGMERFVRRRRRGFATALIVRALSAILIIGGSAFAAKAQERAEPSYVNSERLLQRALDAVFSEIGSTPRISEIVIEPEGVTVRTQGRGAGYHTDEWRISRFRMLWMDWDSVDGPSPQRSNGIVAQEETSLFDLADIPLAEISPVTAVAIARAGMEEAPDVASITISRDVQIMPERRYGAVRWRIHLVTGRESATVYADAAGRVFGGDLSGTIRAQRLDMLRQDDWPMEDAQAELASVIGEDARVHEVTVRKSNLSARVEQPGNPGQLIGFNWNYSGISRSLAALPNIQSIRGEEESFTLSELDLAALPKVKATALEAIGSGLARIDYIVAKKGRTGTREPEVRWRAVVKLDNSLIDLGNQMTGEVTISAKGDLLHVVLPGSMQTPVNWLEPAGMAKAIERLRRDFEPSTLYNSIRFDGDGASVIVEDPMKPGILAQFVVRATGETHRFGTVSPMLTPYDPELLFPLGDIDVLDSALITDINGRTLAAMNLQGAQVYRWTILKRQTTNHGHSILTAEVRAGINFGDKGGWVIYGFDGRELDVMKP